MTSYTYSYFNQNTWKTIIWNSSINDWEIDQKLYYYYSKTLITSTELSEEKIKIYPNPTTDKIIIQLPTNQPTTIILNDLQGRIIQTINNIKEKEYTLSLTNLASGIYILEVSDGKKIYRKKIMKE